MPRAFTPKIVTANSLLEGDVIYLTPDSRWTRNLQEAEVLLDEASAQLRLSLAEGQPGNVVGPYLAEVVPGTHGPEPAHFREDFRRTGPSNYFHGKQAEA